MANAEVEMHSWRGQVRSRDKAMTAGRTEVRLRNCQVEQGGCCDDQSREPPDAVIVNLEC